ncbi:methionine ABC transporter permease [Leadbettera azotonutricia]|uniref:D-methionine transport system permease protein MetI n=1 Tax=Leadbettera azotonutricia (strain ATCC BAA-888 / DSM 13862 / ZAS-9) TaxID=545695 RepID=F5YAH5_LEAAZ|nr:methionine ABC transporter permease [Leadbettera azotonutricia]AEF81292.1 D-methionine transport system permease protein MetI [Leadbettera azotonutricia ZAS-9]
MPEKFMAVLVLLPASTLETLYMTLVSTLLACVLGFPLGAFLYSASPAGLHSRPIIYNALSRVVNILRSLPFIILMILLIPLSRFIIGTSIGPTAVIIPLSIAAAPFVARISESALSEVDNGVITAAKAMGSSNMQIIRKVLIPEALPALVSGLALTIINLIGYSAMAGAIGGGGLGSLAINYGYYRFRMEVTIAAVIIILIIVELVQFVGTAISRRLLSKR